MLASTGLLGIAHSLFQSQDRCSCAMWPCCDINSSDDDEHNTDGNFLLLFADIGIMPTLLEGLTEVDGPTHSPWLQIRSGHIYDLAGIFSCP